MAHVARGQHAWTANIPAALDIEVGINESFINRVSADQPVHATLNAYPQLEEAMIVINIPGLRRLELGRLVLDYNGTLAVDGTMLDGVADALRLASVDLDIHVITADTFGMAAQQLQGLPVHPKDVVDRIADCPEYKLTAVEVSKAAR